MPTTEEIFKQIEIADNFIKYAKPGGEEKARQRARRRYEKALKMAMAEANDDTVKLIQLRMNDLARSAARDAEPEVEDYEGSGGASRSPTSHDMPAIVCLRGNGSPEDGPYCTSVVSRDSTSRPGASRSAVRSRRR